MLRLGVNDAGATEVFRIRVDAVQNSDAETHDLTADLISLHRSVGLEMREEEEEEEEEEVSEDQGTDGYEHAEGSTMMVRERSRRKRTTVASDAEKCLA